MIKEYTHKGYKLVWGDADIKDGMASEWIYDRFGNLLGHATVTGKPPTQEQAEGTIELFIEIMERCVERVEKRLLGGER